MVSAGLKLSAAPANIEQVSDKTFRSSNQPGGGTPGYLPPGWPAQVKPPGTAEWERSASAFLFDCCPADYRAYPVLRRHPVVLASFAASFVASQVGACADSLAQVRLDLGELVAPQVVRAAIDVWQCESAKLARTQREVGLVLEALRGKEFVRSLAST